MDDEAGFESALNKPFDLILCDYNLPNYDALAAVALAQEKQPETPLIVVSGTVGEEVAVKCLHIGATDYLLKQRLDRLVPAVQRALSEAKARRERLRIEEALRESEQFSTLILDTVLDAVITINAEGRITRWNARAATMFGWPQDEVLGLPMAELIMPPQYREHHQLGLKRFLASGQGPVMGKVIEVTALHRSGHEFPVEVAVTPIQRLGKWYFSSFIRDISERKKVEEALVESEERFRQLAEQSSEGFWFVGLKPERIQYVSPAVEKIWGISADRFYQDPGVWLTAVNPDDRARVSKSYEAAVGGQSKRYQEEYRVIRPDGSQSWVISIGTPIHNESGEIIRVAGIVKDITERKKAETEMLRAQRLESIGTLASGVAHDLNNALAPIMMSTEMMRMQYPDATGMIDMILASARRAADMVRQLLTFARGVEGERLLLPPLPLFKEIEKLIRSTFPKNIELKTRYATNSAMVLGDSTQFHQVLLNLCVNARDAMPNGGTLTLELENAEVDAAYASSVPEAKLGRYVVWRVNDTGSGIPPNILERIFEPFFSTKGLDKGTGLGLSTVLGIIKSHGGFVRVYSTVGKGTTFTVYLPASDSARENTGFITEAEVIFRGHGETILVVDDEPSLRQIARAVLTELNFKVLTAGDGTAALIQAVEHRDELRAVITDMHMPNMDGLAFVRVLKHMLPKAGFIVASGGISEREEKEFTELGAAALLKKPFTQQTLVAALKKVLMT